MSDTKWTPGPWDRVVACGNVIKGGIGYPLPIDETQEDGESWLDMRARTAPERDARAAEQEANSQLQKAAPELYEALDDVEQLVVGHLRTMYPKAWAALGSSGQTSLKNIMRNHAGPFLAKARGES